MSNHVLKTDDFKFIVEPEIFSGEYNDTLLHVFVENSKDGYKYFAGRSSMSIWLKEFINFSNDLKILYNTLKGTAAIKECWEPQYIEFCGDGRGHIQINGYLENSTFNLKFEYSFDQTYLQKFIDELINETINNYSHYYE